MRSHPARSTAIAALTLTLGAPTVAAQQKGRFDFTIANMMRGPELYGREPNQVRWSPDGQWIYFQWLPAGTDWREPTRPYRVRAEFDLGKVRPPERVSDAEMDSVGPIVATGALSPDRKLRVTEYRGDLYLVDLRAATARRLTETAGAEGGARFSSDGRRVFFVRDGNAWALEVVGGPLRQLTDIRTPDGAAAQGRGAGRGAAVTQRGALERDQRDLFEAIRDRTRADSVARAERERDDPVLPRTVTLMPNERVAQISVSPSGGSVLFTTTIPAGTASRGTIVPNYVTASGYTEDIAVRTKVGDALNAGRIGFMTLPRGTVTWIRPIDGDSTPPAQQNVVSWNDAGSSALITATTRNWKTRQVSIVDGRTGALRAVEVIRDSAWVGGPCGGCAGFYDDDRRIYWVSETNGWAQLHSAAADASDRRELTGLGKWEIYDVSLSNDRRWFHLHSSETSPFDRDLWRMPIAGGARTKLTSAAGGHQAVFSPDESKLADVYSTEHRPPDLHLLSVCLPGARCGDGPVFTRLTTSYTADWAAGPWIRPEIVMIPASDGVPVPAHIYRPKDVGARPNGAGVIFVHGAGYLHNVHHYWSSYPREYMFNHYLASKGYVVLDIDYRASAGYGRDWRTAIYRWMGGRDLADQVDGSRYLTKTFGINPERIGIYGGSYGGFMTLMALFTAPKYFGAGAALRSVTDWAHYNHPYTSQILNQPQDDTLAFRRSSPIYFAQGLEDPLLMAHGMVDVNVHYQDIVRLTQRLIELGKTDWELASYPVEDHGFTRPSSWADEYRRIFELFERTIGPNGNKRTDR
jgi:dipeptidyl aminopeptidase/acylaminoacyl peptidase